jgi:dienelactone hydrolase
MMVFKKISLGVYVLGFILLWVFQDPLPAEVVKPDSAKIEVESRRVDIWSDGIRLAGNLWYPKGLKAGDKLPAIICCNGWGGLRQQLDIALAPFLAKAGYVVLTFDYRGWGESDSRLVIKGKMPLPDSNGELIVKARAIRELVDPFEHVEDIIASLDFLSAEPSVDFDRIGLWGTSFGGGHVVYVAAHDDRVKCIVSMVPGMDSSTVHQFFPTRKTASHRARGEFDPVPQWGNLLADSGNPNVLGQEETDLVSQWKKTKFAPILKGTPHLSRIGKYRPVQFAEKLKVPTLIIVAENDEVNNNQEHGKKVYDLIKDRVKAKYEVYPGTHFDVYSRGRMTVIAWAIEWFDKHLKLSTSK